MKKAAILTMLLASGSLAATADNYSFLNIEKTDGTAQSLTAIGLTITYNGSTMTATNGSEQATFALADISRMYFSNTQIVEAGISSTLTPATPTPQAGDGIYNLQGHRVGGLDARQSLKKGIYIIRENGRTKTIQVK